MMLALWQELRLGDCLNLISGGTPSKERNDYWGGNIPWVSCKDMKVERIYDAEDHLTSLGAENGTRIVTENTILFVVRGMILARELPIAMTKRMVAFNQDLKAVKPAEFIDTRFLLYWFRANTYEILGRVDEAGHGTKRLQTDRLLALPIRVPSLYMQRKIASILSAYDDLIENNQRRIKILENMARALYREWFVHFRFPGYENVPRVDSPFGEIPKGWEVKKLGELCSFISRGISPQYSDEGDSFVINQKCIREKRLNLDPARRQSKSISPEKLVRFGDILINSTGVGTLGRVAQVYEHLDKYTVDSHVTIARPQKVVNTDFFGCSLLHLQYSFEKLGVGATGQTELNRAAIAEVQVIVPPEKHQVLFGQTVNSIRMAAVIYGRRIVNLRRTRNLLLPRLMSGQIEVEYLD